MSRASSQTRRSRSARGRGVGARMYSHSLAGDPTEKYGLQTPTEQTRPRSARYCTDECRANFDTSDIWDKCQVLRCITHGRRGGGGRGGQNAGWGRPGRQLRGQPRAALTGGFRHHCFRGAPVNEQRVGCGTVRVVVALRRVRTRAPRAPSTLAVLHPTRAAQLTHPTGSTRNSPIDELNFLPVIEVGTSYLEVLASS